MQAGLKQEMLIAPISMSEIVGEPNACRTIECLGHGQALDKLIPRWPCGGASPKRKIRNISDYLPPAAATTASRNCFERGSASIFRTRMISLGLTADP